MSNPERSLPGKLKAILVKGVLVYSVITFFPLKPYEVWASMRFYATTIGPPEIFRITNFFTVNSPWFFENTAGRNFAGLALTWLSCLVLACIWEYLNPGNRHKHAVSSFTFTLLRYQLAMRLSHYAFIKLFPLQMPFPTLSQLNSKLGDFTAEKFYWLSVGVSPAFEVFSGVSELIVCLLLLFRRTALLGASLAFGIMLPVWIINMTYNTGVQLFSFHILCLSVLLLLPFSNQFVHFFFSGKPAELKAPSFTIRKAALRRITLLLHSVFIAFFFVFQGAALCFFYQAGKNIKLPNTPGLRHLAGYYEVESFLLNGQEIPFHPTDTLRWQNMVFEHFNTISIQNNKVHGEYLQSARRNQEFFGTTGRKYYEYASDSLAQTLLLKDRLHKDRMMRLNYRQPDPQHLVLQGINEAADSIFVRLVRIDKEYTLKPDGR